MPDDAVATDQAFKKSPIGGSIGNLAVRLPGTVKAPRRMLSAHMDTVPICAGARPVRKGRRSSRPTPHTGLGGDDRSGCAVLLATALAILEQKLPHPPLTFLWTVQEEAGLNGAHYVRLPMLKSPKLAFNWDGGAANRVTIGATGGYRMNIVVEGVASHAGVHPERGVSAIAIASLAIADLVENGWHGLIERSGKRGTSNVGVIHGGSATNVVTDRVELRAEARSHDPKFRERIVREIEKAFAKAAKAVRNVDGATGRREVRRPARLRIVQARSQRAVGDGGRRGARRRRPGTRLRDRQRRARRQLAHRPRHSDRHARLRPERYPHGRRVARSRPLHRRLPRGASDRYERLTQPRRHEDTTEYNES